MAGDDLSSITGMEDKHRRALARRQITTLGGLAGADRQVIYRAMGSIKPRPTLSQIGRWQDEARGRLDEARGRDETRGGDEAPGRPDEAPGRPEEARGRPEEAAVDIKDWHPVASFAVVFARRRAGDAWERRVEAERTEVEPERDPEVWPGWECSPICAWMLGQVGQADSAEPGQPGQAQRAGPGPAEPGVATPPGRRPRLRIDSAAIIDATGRAGVVTGGAPVADPPAGLVAPTRLVFTVGGARSGREVRAVARFRGQGRPGRNAGEPVAVPPSGQAEFDLSQVTAGQLEMTLLAWAPDGSARPVSVRLPAMTIGPAADPN